MPFSSQSRRHPHHQQQQQQQQQQQRSNIDGVALSSTSSASACHPDQHTNNRHFPYRNQTNTYSTYYPGTAGAPPPLKRRRSDDDPEAVIYDARRSHHMQHHHNWEGGPSTSRSSFPQQQQMGSHLNGVSLSGGSRGGCSDDRWGPARQVEPAVPLEDGDKALVSRDEIEQRSPSRKDGINLVLETQLRHSYCSYLQHLGMRLQLPQTTVGTAIVLCHRFFFRRSHASHDRFLIATAALFLTAKSEETPCLLNSVIRASCEVSQELDLPFFPYLVHSDWFVQFRERIIEAEQLILTTLDFELDVEHPYVPLTSVLRKLGLSETVLVVAWNLINEGLRTSLWLQFKPHQIAAGAAFLAAKFLNFDLAFHPSFWTAFQTSPFIIQDVVQQLMELL